MTPHPTAGRVLTEIEDSAQDLIALTTDLIRIPTVNPPGDKYRECAEYIGRRLEHIGMGVQYVEADGLPEHTAFNPRVNVVGRLEGRSPRPCLHLNGHFDVVPAGEGWTKDPFGAEVADGRIYGRGASDMKSGLAAAIIAVEAIHRSGVLLKGTVEISGTVDEESGGFAGVAHLCEQGLIGADRTDFVIIPEPFGPDRICVGHKGVYWFDVVAHGRVAHGSMPHLGRSAIDDMTALLAALRSALDPQLAERVSEMPVVPSAARSPSLNVNAVEGGQSGETVQSPCVADQCTATFDRRFIAEESLDEVREEVQTVLRALQAEDPGRRYTVHDRMVVEPTQAPVDSPLIGSLTNAVREVRGVDAELVGSPGTYDQKHVARIGGVHHCVAYGPGPLQEAHQPDESCSISDLVASAKVMALTILDLVG